jgi:DNA-binding transcriptional MerR regulator
MTVERPIEQQNNKFGGIRVKINQVEELVGITKKNIRFYEEQGLIKPDRNPENGYRDYNLKDVDRLMKIKLLRKLDVPIEEIRRLDECAISIDECMEKQIIRLNHEQHDIEMMKELCGKISDEIDDISKLDAPKYLSEMEKMEKGGTRFMDIAKDDIKKKKYGSAISAVFMILVFAAIIGLVLWANKLDPIPLGILIFIVAVLAGIIIGIIIAFRQRILEIDGGEENEAGKY